MQMNKKGFSLIEIIGVILILGIFMLIGTTNVLGTTNKAKEKLSEEVRRNFRESALTYAIENFKFSKCSVSLSSEIESGNLSNVTDTNTCLKKITAKEVKEKGFFEDKRGFCKEEEYVIVYRYNDGSYSEYKEYLSDTACKNF